ncbi:hypothetical protein, partial [Listeria booriae]
MEYEKENPNLNLEIFNETLYVASPELIDDRDYQIATRQDILKHLDWENEYEISSYGFQIQAMRIASRLEQWPESISLELKAAYEKDPLPNCDRVSMDQLHFMKNLVKKDDGFVETLKGLINADALGLYKYEPHEDRYEDPHIKVIEASEIKSHYVSPVAELQEEQKLHFEKGGEESMSTYQEE